ncbi:hypothetical protein ABTF03_18945, partial [Acinetobacter baumannii]
MRYKAPGSRHPARPYADAGSPERRFRLSLTAKSTNACYGRGKRARDAWSATMNRLTGLFLAFVVLAGAAMPAAAQ